MDLFVSGSGGGEQIIFKCRLKMLTDGSVRTDSGKLFQIRGAAELKARLANTVLSAGWESRRQSDDRSWRAGVQPLNRTDRWSG